MQDTGFREIHPSERQQQASMKLPANHHWRISGPIIAGLPYCARFGYPPCESCLRNRKNRHQALAKTG
jgi:hypothetical protein